MTRFTSPRTPIYAAMYDFMERNKAEKQQALRGKEVGDLKSSNTRMTCLIWVGLGIFGMVYNYV